jgi:L-amino acid N-acyltransferase YncA
MGETSHTVPNVREHNRAAIRMDERLGFQTACQYDEAIW